MREHASNWLELAQKVLHYRKDVLAPAGVTEIQSRAAKVRSDVKEGANAAKLKLSIESLEETLRRNGGKIYPKSSLVENVEFFLVAAIVILGIRTFFVQPFKIPTNSMWPSYYGMTPEVFRATADEPNSALGVFRFLTIGARSRRVDAPESGEVAIPVDSSGRIYYHEVPGRSWLIFPTKLKEYTLMVNQSPVRVKVPLDFDFDWVLREAFFPEEKSLAAGFGKLKQRGRSISGTLNDGGRAVPVTLYHTDKKVQAGERVLSFDILTGDQLFVDRFSYHFVRPSVGSGFVFRTGNIEMLRERSGDQYYIKRLVGLPGDTIEVAVNESATREAGPYSYPVGTLRRNGQVIEGAKAFQLNNDRIGQYSGYQARGLLSPGLKVEVPAKHYYAMGDNSGNSYDGRDWGYVPEKDVVGRPLWIYFPFTKRWGPAP